MKLQSIIWYKENKEKMREYKRWYEKNGTIINTLSRKYRDRLRKALKKNKTFHTIDYLGCSIPEFKLYIENQFQEGMNWNNYGSKWHIDHFIPISSFDLINEQEKKEAFNWLNCQPLWKKDNLIKGKKLPYVTLVMLAVFSFVLTANAHNPSPDPEDCGPGPFVGAPDIVGKCKQGSIHIHVCIPAIDPLKIDPPDVPSTSLGIFDKNTDIKIFCSPAGPSEKHGIDLPCTKDRQPRAVYAQTFNEDVADIGTCDVSLDGTIVSDSSNDEWYNVAPGQIKLKRK